MSPQILCETKQTGSGLSFQENYLKLKTWPDGDTAAPTATARTHGHRHGHSDRHPCVTPTVAAPVRLALRHHELSSACNYCTPESQSPLSPPWPGRRLHPHIAPF